MSWKELFRQIVLLESVSIVIMSRRNSVGFQRRMQLCNARKKMQNVINVIMARRKLVGFLRGLQHLQHDSQFWSVFLVEIHRNQRPTN